MAICGHCHQQMQKHVSCLMNVVEYPDGLVLAPIPWLEAQPCPDCFTPPDGYHHPGCDREICPRCKGQLIACACFASEQDYQPKGEITA